MAHNMRVNNGYKDMKESAPSPITSFFFFLLCSFIFGIFFRTISPVKATRKARKIPAVSAYMKGKRREKQINLPISLCLPTSADETIRELSKADQVDNIVIDTTVAMYLQYMPYGSGEIFFSSVILLMEVPQSRTLA